MYVSVLCKSILRKTNYLLLDSCCCWRESTTMETWRALESLWSVKLSQRHYVKRPFAYFAFLAESISSDLAARWSVCIFSWLTVTGGWFFARSYRRLIMLFRASVRRFFLSADIQHLAVKPWNKSCAAERRRSEGALHWYGPATAGWDWVVLVIPASCPLAGGGL